MKVFSVRLAAICAAALPFAALVAHGGVVVYPEYDARIERLSRTAASWFIPSTTRG